MAKVLLYNLSGKDKLKKIKLILFKLGIAAREVSRDEYRLPVGTLAGLESLEVTEDTLFDDFRDEMMVLCGLNPVQFQGLLNALRQNRVPVALKAVLTETNACWSSCHLHLELSAEHEALQKAAPQKASVFSTHQ